MLTESGKSVGDFSVSLAATWIVEGMKKMQFKPSKSWWLLGVGVLSGAGVAYAADPRYDEADATINKAVAQLNAVQVPNEKPGAAFQRKRAIKALERAKIRIACAKEATDKGTRGCPAAMRDRFDDNDDDKGDGKGHDHDHKGHDHKDHDKGHGKDKDKGHGKDKDKGHGKDKDKDGKK
jgi:hypothetical protein